MADNPYRHLPQNAFWKRSVAQPNFSDVDPVVGFPFRIRKSEKVATAGSCFAQHIARNLAARGFNFLVTEKPHPLFAERGAEDGYGVFTARYGNIYTSRQLLQLYRRAYGEFAPADDAWRAADGTWVDPFRPTVQPGNFSSIEALHADREQHFACVREAFETLDYFVFTLGLTECWEAKADGAILPVCPGVSGGEYSDDRYRFKQLSVHEIVADMGEFIGLLRGVNPNAKVILTVSPVPLAATAAGGHVMVATSLSKSILRVSAETLATTIADVAYFPSYEIIVGSYNRGRYFGEDLRSISEEGVGHVMRLFVHHGTEFQSDAAPEAPAAPVETASGKDFLATMQTFNQVLCDEESLAQFGDEAAQSA